MRRPWALLCLTLLTAVLCEDAGGGEDEECPAEELREKVRAGYFQGRITTPVIASCYVLLWVAALFDLWLLCKKSESDDETAAAQYAILPVMPSLAARLKIHLRRARKQMIHVHFNASLITVAILYSSFFSKLFGSICAAVRGQQQVHECPKQLCAYEAKDDDPEWGGVISAYVCAVLAGLLLFRVLVICEQKGFFRTFWVQFAAGFIGHVLGFRWKAVITKLYSDFYDHTAFLDMFQFKGYFINAWVPYNNYSSAHLCAENVSFTDGNLSGTVNVSRVAGCESFSLAAGLEQPEIPFTISDGLANISWWADGDMHWSGFPGVFLTANTCSVHAVYSTTILEHCAAGQRPFNFPTNETCFLVNYQNESSDDFWPSWGNNLWCSSDLAVTSDGWDSYPRHYLMDALTGINEAAYEYNIFFQKAESVVKGWWFKGSVYIDELGFILCKTIIFSLITISVLIAWRVLLAWRQKGIDRQLAKGWTSNSAHGFDITLTEPLMEPTTSGDEAVLQPIAGREAEVALEPLAALESESHDAPVKASRAFKRDLKEMVHQSTEKLDEIMVQVLNESAGLVIGWLVAKLVYWVLYGAVVALSGSGSWNGISVDHWTLKAVIFLVAVSTMTSITSRLVHWIEKRNSGDHPLWLAAYWGGVEEVVAKWSIGYLLYLFIQQEMFYFDAQRDEFRQGNAATCLFGTTVFSGSYPRAEALNELFHLIQQPLAGVLFLMLYIIAADRSAVDAELYSEWMATVARVVRVADSAAPGVDLDLAKHVQEAAGIRSEDQNHLQAFVQEQAKRGQKLDHLMRFILAYASIQAGLGFEEFIDNLVEILMGCKENFLFSTKDACEEASVAKLSILQSLLFLVLAMGFNLIQVLLCKYVFIPHGLVGEGLDEYATAPTATEEETNDLLLLQPEGTVTRS